MMDTIEVTNDVYYYEVIKYNEAFDNICSKEYYISQNKECIFFSFHDMYNDYEVSKYRFNVKKNKLEIVTTEFFRYEEELKEEYKKYNIDINIMRVSYSTYTVSIYINNCLCNNFITHDNKMKLRQESGIYESNLFAQIFFENKLIEAIQHYENNYGNINE